MANEQGSAPYEIDKRIKDAICGDVYTGFHLQPADNNIYTRKEFVVIKIISLQKVELIKNRSKLQEDPIKELSILQMFDEKSSNVCDQIDCISDEKFIYSIMRHYGEELFNHAGKLSEDVARDYFRQIIKGVETLQRLDVCHRDLSLENILVSADGVCTIIDFGMSLIYPSADSSTYNSTLETLSNQPITHMKDASNSKQIVLMPPQGTCGKKNYIAPEILQNLDAFNGAMVDNWSLGVILFMLLTGRPPFHRASMLDKWYRMIQQQKLKEMLSLWKVDGLSDASLCLLQKLLAGGGDPHSRLTTDDMLGHPWLATVVTDITDTCRGV